MFHIDQPWCKVCQALAEVKQRLQPSINKQDEGHFTATHVAVNASARQRSAALRTHRRSPAATSTCLQATNSNIMVPDALVFHLPAPPKRVIHMPLPFASMTSASSRNGSNASQNVPKLVWTPPTTQGSKSTDTGTAKGSHKEERILISEVEVVGVDGQLKDIANSVLRTRPNFAYTFQEVKQDVARVFATGWFRECVPDAVDTRDGVKLVIKVTPNDEVRGMVAAGANMLPNAVVQNAFQDLYGKNLNFVTLRQAVNSLDKWYSERGILGQVTDVDFVDGIINVECAEAVVNDISLSFLDNKTQQPVAKPKTRKEVITRHITTQPGQVYNLKQARRDIASIYATGLFEDVNIIPKESDDSTETAPKVDLVVSLVERKTGGVGAGGGLSTQARGEGALPGFVGNFSYTEKNLFGLNQKLSAMVELGQIDKIFKIQHTDPWILGDPHRTSRTIQILNNRTSGIAVHGKVEPETSAGPGRPASGLTRRQTNDGGNLIIGRLIAGIEYQRPLSNSWSGTLGGSLCRTTCLSELGKPTTVDCYGAPLTFSGGPADRMAVVATSAMYSSPDDNTSMVFSLDSALPVHRDWLRFARFRMRVDKPIPLIGPLTLHCRLRGGLVHGDLPPFEAFIIGGTNSVRGYAEGGVGTGRRWLEASSELRFPLFVSAVSGCVFADWGSDLDSGASVIGDPAGARGKPGSGYACGAGVRVDTPVGPLRLEYAWNAEKQGRFHVGVGYD